MFSTLSLQNIKSPEVMHSHQTSLEEYTRSLSYCVFGSHSFNHILTGNAASFKLVITLVEAELRDQMKDLSASI